jgi:hypothetical protein
MEQVIDQKAMAFIDRRQNPGAERSSGPERRQFRDANESFAPEVQELAEAIDLYKLQHRRRFITFEELFDVITGLGYHK